MTGEARHKTRQDVSPASPIASFRRNGRQGKAAHFVRLDEDAPAQLDSRESLALVAAVGAFGVGGADGGAPPAEGVFRLEQVHVDSQSRVMVREVLEEEGSRCPACTTANDGDARSGKRMVALRRREERMLLLLPKVDWNGPGVVLIALGYE